MEGYSAPAARAERARSPSANSRSLAVPAPRARLAAPAPRAAAARQDNSAAPVLIMQQACAQPAAQDLPASLLVLRQRAPGARAVRAEPTRRKATAKMAARAAPA